MLQALPTLARSVPQARFSPRGSVAMWSIDEAFVQHLDLPRLAEQPLDGGVDLGILGLQMGATLFAACFGFGDAVIAVPLLILWYQLSLVQAAPLVTCVSTFLGVVVLLSDTLEGRTQAIGRWKESALLLSSAALGVPLGVHALQEVEPILIRAAIGAILIVYGSWSLASSARSNRDDDDAEGVGRAAELGVADRGRQPETARSRGRGLIDLLPALPAGFIAGGLCGAVGEPGPAAVVYGSLKNWRPDVLRGMLARFFVPVQLLAINEYAAQGLLSDGLLEQAAYTMPGVLCSAYVGTKLNRAFDAAAFGRIINAIIVVLGVASLYSALILGVE
jgi:uncharacterized membrane protein YfcA